MGEMPIRALCPVQPLLSFILIFVCGDVTFKSPNLQVVVVVPCVEAIPLSTLQQPYLLPIFVGE